MVIAAYIRRVMVDVGKMLAIANTMRMELMGVASVVSKKDSE